jgi:hypothetical protein
MCADTYYILCHLRCAIVDNGDRKSERAREERERETEKVISTSHETFPF